MARDGKNRDPKVNDQEEITFVMFKYKGSSDSVREGLKTIAELSNQLRGPTTAALRILPQTLQPVPPVAAAADIGISEEDIIGPAEIQQSETAEPSLRSDRSSKPRKYKTPEIIKDLNPDSVNPSLKDYYTEYGSPTETFKKYIIVASWLKNHYNTAFFGDGHIYTCFKFMGWPVQRDLLQPVRGMKKKGWFTVGAERATYSINHIGEEEVRKIKG